MMSNYTAYTGESYQPSGLAKDSKVSTVVFVLSQFIYSRALYFFHY